MARYRYPLPRAYRRARHPYKYRKGDGGAGPAAGLAIGTVLAIGAGGGTAATVITRHAPSAAAPPSGAGSAPVTSGSETAFIRAVLADLGAPATGADISSLAAWFPREYPSWPPWAANNPMSSTLRMPGSSIYNSVGVRNYPTAAEGAQATALTLEDGYYPLITAALRAGTGLCGVAPDEFEIWSGGGYPGVC